MQNFEDNILAYLENELSEKERTDFEQELAKNKALQAALKEMEFAKDCLAELKQEQQVEAEIKRRTPELNAELARIIADIDSEKKTTIIPITEQKKNNLPRIFSIAASIFLILGLGWWFSQEKENPYIQNHFVDYTVAAQMSSDITPFTALSNAYIENDDDMFRKTLQNVQPKDTAEFYALYAMKGTMEKRRKLYPDALSSFLTAENYAKTETEKIQTAVNQITLLLATKQNEKAKERLKSLLAQIPSAGKNITIEALQKDINNLKD